MIKTISKINNNKTQTIQIINNPNGFFLKISLGRPRINGNGL